MKRALVFAGAGASFAVDPKSYPTTVQFFDNLPDSIQRNPLIDAISKNLPAKFGEGPGDVEKILWCLAELHDYLAATKDSKHPASWFIPSNFLPGLVGSKHPVGEFAAAARDAIPVISRLRDQITAKVYEFYSTLPTRESLAGNWQYLLNSLDSHALWPDIITTNYDLVIEHAAEFANRPINFGQRNNIVRTLDLDVWRQLLSDPDHMPKNGLLTKLHGSVNWLREHGRIVFGGTEFVGDHSHHGVIYPGFKGVPAAEPFSLLHSYFETAIQRADAIIFIGFAFRDEYITTCLERNIGNKLIQLIDPGEVKIPPGLKGRVRQIKGKFNKEAIADLDYGISSKVLEPA